MVQQARTPTHVSSSIRCPSTRGATTSNRKGLWSPAVFEWYPRSVNELDRVESGIHGEVYLFSHVNQCIVVTPLDRIDDPRQRPVVDIGMGLRWGLLGCSLSLYGWNGRWACFILQFHRTCCWRSGWTSHFERKLVKMYVADLAWVWPCFIWKVVLHLIVWPFPHQTLATYRVRVCQPWMSARRLNQYFTLHGRCLVCRWSCH